MNTKINSVKPFKPVQLLTNIMANNTFIIIDKNGVLKEQNSRALTRDCLYKKCGFRKSEGFEQIHVWSAEETCSHHAVELWGKKTGKKGQENTYSFQFANDAKMYYGALALISVDSNNHVLDLTMDTWQNIQHTISGENKHTTVDMNKETIASLHHEAIRDDDESNSDVLSSGSELEEEEYYYSDN